MRKNPSTRISAQMSERVRKNPPPFPPLGGGKGGGEFLRACAPPFPLTNPEKDFCALFCAPPTSMRLTAAQLTALGWNPDGTRIASTKPTASPAVAREADLHDAILAHCRAKGWPVVHSRMDRPSTSGVGTPDFVVALPSGTTVWIEAKASGGKLRPEQAAWLAALRILGHRAEVVRSLPEFLALVSPEPTAP